MRGLLIGKNIRLTAIRDEDLVVIEDWFNDTKFLRYYDMVPAIPKHQREVKKLLDDVIDASDRVVFAIRDKETDGIIGITGFDEIFWSNGVATCFLGIGDNRYNGRGLGKEALKLLLDFGFNELNFYRIQLNVIAYNEAAIHLYESQGFVREGTYRKFIFRDGKRYDMYLYSLLVEEWKGSMP